MQRWGIPVLVGEISNAAALIPGEIVDIRLQ
jgi:hypothetical protein